MTLVGVVSGLIDVDNPSIDDIHVGDFVVGLSNICRWGGQTLGWWSVAQHSLAVEYLAATAPAGKGVCLAALLHDAHEAYIGDVVTPLKRRLGDPYKEVRDSLDRVIAGRFGISSSLFHHEVVRMADEAMLHVEHAHLRPEVDLGVPVSSPGVARMIERARDSWIESALRSPATTIPNPDVLTTRVTFRRMLATLKSRDAGG